MDEGEKRSVLQKIALAKQEIVSEEEKERPFLAPMETHRLETERLMAKKFPLPWYAFPLWFPWKWFHNKKIEKSNELAKSYAKKANVHRHRINDLTTEISDFEWKGRS